MIGHEIGTWSVASHVQVLDRLVIDPFRLHGLKSSFLSRVNNGCSKVIMPFFSMFVKKNRAHREVFFYSCRIIQFFECRRSVFDVLFVFVYQMFNCIPV